MHGPRRLPCPGAASRRRLVVVMALVLGGCGSGDGAAGCEPARRESLDDRSFTHVLPGNPEPDYATDPPTSGPHQPAPELSGVRSEPLSRPLQVGVLERGGVLIQHRDAADRAALADLAGDGVVVAPNPVLPARVVATAWTFKQTCTGIDLDALREFVADHGEQQGRGPH